MKTIYLLFIFALIGAGCFTNDDWKSFYYPDANNLSTVVISPIPLESLEKCREIIDFNRRIHNPNGEKLDDYECGKNCKLQDSDTQLYVCEETVE